MATSVRDLPGLRLGTRVHLYLDGAEEAYITRIDDLDKDWIAVAVMDEDFADWRPGRPVDAEVPQPVGLLYISGTVLERRSGAVPLVAIRVERVGADPEVGVTGEQRRHVRVPLTLPLDRFAIERAGRWEEVSAILRDLSASGASVLCDVAAAPATKVWFRFPMPLEGTECTVRGTVLLCQEVGSTRQRRYRLGIDFADLAPPDRNWLARQLHQMQTAGRR